MVAEFESQTQDGRASAAQASSPAGASDAAVLREQLKDQMRAVQEAARDLEQEANQVHVENGQIRGPGGPGPGRPNMPGSTGQGPDIHNMIPPQAVDIAMGFFMMCAAMVIGWPLARAFGRRLERGGTQPGAVPVAMADQLARIEQAVEAMAVEVERISESQRYLTKLQSAPAGERIPLQAGSERR